MNRRDIWAGSRCLMTILMVTMITGCHSSAPPNTSAMIGPAPTKAQQIQAVQNNVHIPPQVKAQIIKKLEGQGAPTTQPGKPPQ